MFWCAFSENHVILTGDFVVSVRRELLVFQQQNYHLILTLNNHVFCTRMVCWCAFGENHVVLTGDFVVSVRRELLMFHQLNYHLISTPKNHVFYNRMMC